MQVIDLRRVHCWNPEKHETGSRLRYVSDGSNAVMWKHVQSNIEDIQQTKNVLYWTYCCCVSVKKQCSIVRGFAKVSGLCSKRIFCLG